MAEYEFRISQYTRESCTVYVEADDEDQAEEIVKSNYHNGDYDEEFENDLDERAPGGQGYEIELIGEV